MVSASETKPPSAQSVNLLSTGNARRLVLVLAAVNLCNFMDRKLIAVLVPSIKADLHLTDSEIGLLTGLAFAITYALVGVPLSWLSERIDRRKLIAVVLSIWCAMTALSGVAVNFVQMMLFRMGVAVGEAGASPASYAMISDAYPQSKRAGAISVFTSGGQVGGFLGALLGGWIAQLIGWREAFVIIGLIGLVLVPFLFFGVKDPPRGGSDGLAERAPTPFAEAIRVILRVPTFQQNVAAASLTAIVTYSLTTWLPSVLVRSYDVSIGEAGTILAFMTLITGAGSALLGGQVCSVLGQRDLRYWSWIPSACFVLATPLLAIAFLLPNVWATVGGVAGAYGLVSFSYGANYAALNTTVPPRVRATASAVALLMVTLIGLGLGPLLMGMASDFFSVQYGSDGLRVAIIVPTIAVLWGGLHFGLMARTIREDATAALIEPAEPK